MPLQVADLNTLEAYLDGVMNRSEHHADTVRGVALASISTYDSAVRALRSFLAEAAPFTVQPRHAVNGVKS